MKYKIGQVWESSKDPKVRKFLILSVLPHAHHENINYVLCQDIYNPGPLNKVFAFEQVHGFCAQLGEPKLDKLLFDPYKEFLKEIPE